MGKNFIEIKIDTWDNFKSEINNRNLGNNWIFRGHANSNWKLENSLVRDSFTAQEDKMKNEFQEAASLFVESNHLPNSDDLFGWWSLMQHHGVPTRLLDFTYSPYIASYFAFEENTNNTIEYVAVWAINIKNILSATREFLEVTSIDDIFILKNEAFTNKHNIVIPIKPFLHHLRPFSQFSIFLCSLNKNKPMLDQLKTKSHNDIIKILIPYSERVKALTDLNRMRINSSSLFPDLDGFSKSIRIANELDIYIYDTACYLNKSDDVAFINFLKDLISSD